VTITPTTATGTTVQDSAIGPELQAQITAQHLPAPTNDAQGYPNTLYVLFFPQSILVNYGGLSCQGFCGYHGAYPANGNATFAYAVIPDMGTGSGCATGCSDQCTTGDTAVMVGTISHELAEAVSDPANTPGWVNPNQSSQNSEIGDICTGNGKTQTDTGPVPGTSILAQYEWSQRDKQCLLANPGVDAGSGSSSGGSSGGSSGSSSGSSSGGSSGGSSGSGSSSGGSSGSGSGSSSGSSSGGAHGVDGGSSGGSSDAGSGNFDTPASSTGCGCSEAGQTTSGAAMAGLALLGVLGVARRRRR
jgi:MYXO-CTERM domain-containing protein